MLTPNSFWRDVKNAEPYTQGYWHGYYDLGTKVCTDYSGLNYSGLTYSESTLSPDDYRDGWSDGQDDRWSYVNDKGFGPGKQYRYKKESGYEIANDLFDGMIVALMGDAYVFDPYYVLAATRYFRYKDGAWVGLDEIDIAKLRGV